jgi:hypothetical protein
MNRLSMQSQRYAIRLFYNTGSTDNVMCHRMVIYRI